MSAYRLLASFHSAPSTAKMPCGVIGAKRWARTSEASKSLNRLIRTCLMFRGSQVKYTRWVRMREA